MCVCVCACVCVCVCVVHLGFNGSYRCKHRDTAASNALFTDHYIFYLTEAKPIDIYHQPVISGKDYKIFYKCEQ